MENKDANDYDYTEEHNKLLVRALKSKLHAEKSWPANSFPTLDEVENGTVSDDLFDGRTIQLSDDLIWRLHQSFCLDILDDMLAYVKNCCGVKLECPTGSDNERKCLDLCKYMFDLFQLGERLELAAFMPDICDGYEKIMLHDDFEYKEFFYRIMFEVRNVVDEGFSPRRWIACIVRSGCTPLQSPRQPCACLAGDNLPPSLFDLVTIMVTQGSNSDARENVRSIVQMCADSGNCDRWRAILDYVHQKHVSLSEFVSAELPEEQSVTRCAVFIAECDDKLAKIAADQKCLDRKRKRCEFMRGVAKQRLEDV